MEEKRENRATALTSMDSLLFPSLLAPVWVFVSFFFLLATGRAGIGSSLKKAGKKKLNQQRKRENEKS